VSPIGLKSLLHIIENWFQVRSEIFKSPRNCLFVVTGRQLQKLKVDILTLVVSLDYEFIV
jgi:hypothetical protein